MSWRKTITSGIGSFAKATNWVAALGTVMQRNGKAMRYRAKARDSNTTYSDAKALQSIERQRDEKQRNSISSRCIAEKRTTAGLQEYNLASLRQISD